MSSASERIYSTHETFDKRCHVECISAQRLLSRRYKVARRESSGAFTTSSVGRFLAENP